MLTIHNAVEMARALDSPLDPELKLLLELRRDQVSGYEGYEIGDLAHFTVVGVGDDLVAIERFLGFSPLTNLVDGSRYGALGFTPSTEWIADHGRWWEAVWVLSDDGFGAVLFVSKADGANAELQAFCRDFASAAPAVPSPPITHDPQETAHP